MFIDIDCRHTLTLFSNTHTCTHRHSCTVIAKYSYLLHCEILFQFTLSLIFSSFVYNIVFITFFFYGIFSHLSLGILLFYFDLFSSAFIVGFFSLSLNPFVFNHFSLFHQSICILSSLFNSFLSLPSFSSHLYICFRLLLSLYTIQPFSCTYSNYLL